MSVQSYRLTVVACAVSWLMVGLHARGLRHVLTSHDHSPGWVVLAASAAVAVVGILTLAALLRATPGGPKPPIGPSASV